MIELNKIYKDKKMKKKTWQVPIINGKPYTGKEHSYYINEKAEELKPSNYTFEAELKFDGINHFSTSGIGFIFIDANRDAYYMTKTNFVNCVPFLIEGKLKGRFGFTKQGNTLSIAFLNS